MRLYPTFANRDFTARLSQPDIVFSVETYSHQAIGGPESCTIKASGSLTALWELVEMLRCPVEVVDERSECVWWGYVNTVEIATGTYQYGVSLDSMANRIRVVYTATGTAARSETDWASDADSVTEYGTKEIQQSISDITTEQATNARDTALGQRRFPVPVVALASAEAATATITCRGWWDTLDWQHYTYVAVPIIGNTGTTMVAPLGYSHSTATARATGFEEDTGYGGILRNTFQLWDSAGEAQTRKIMPGGAAMGLYEYREYLLRWTLPPVATNLVNVATLYLESRPDKPAWLTRTTLWVGGAYLFRNYALYPAGWPGDLSTTLEVKGPTKFAGTFVSPGAPYTVSWVRLGIYPLGTPADSVVIELRANGANNQPGALITSITTTQTGYRQYHFSGPVTFAASTTYHLVIYHSSGAAITNNYYQVSLAGSGGWVDFGSGYVSTYYSPYYQFDDTQGLAAQLGLILAASMQFVTAVDLVTSVTIDLPTNNDTDATSQQVIRQILASATAQRLLATIDRARRLRIYDEPTAGSADYRLSSNGDVIDPYGNRVEPHRATAGVWMRLSDVIPASADLSKLASAERFFAERVEYVAGADTVVLYPRAIEDPFDFSDIEVG